MVTVSCRKLVIMLLLICGSVLAVSGISSATTFYVNSGDDYDSISDVINNEATTGDTIIFYDGTYNLTGTIAVEVSGLTLKSETKGGAKLYRDSDYVFEIDYNCAVTIDGFYMGSVDGNAYQAIYHEGGVPSGPVTITNNVFEGFQDYTIEALFDFDFFSTSQTLTVTGNTFRNSSEGVYLGIEGWSVNISDNTFEDCNFGIEIGSFTPYGLRKNVQIKGNTITASSGSGCSYGIYVEDAGGWTTLEISGNTIEGDYEHGIYFVGIAVNGEDLPSSTTIIESNRISVTGTGIGFGLLFDSGVGELTVRYNTLEENNYGVKIDALGALASHPQSDILFTANNIEDNWFGFFNGGNGLVINAENNWWGNSSGPTHDDNSEGTGDIVSDSVDYDPWLGSAYVDGTDSSSGCNISALPAMGFLLILPLVFLTKIK